MTELEQYLQAYFKLRPEELREIVALFSFKELKKGDFLLHTGSYCTQLCFVSTGILRLYALVDDKEVTQWISTQGHFVTDLSSFMFDLPARWHIHALTDCSFYSIQKSDYQVIEKYVPRWNEIEKAFLSECFASIEDRIFRHLSMSAEERYAFFFEQNPALFNQIPLQYIASMLGMTPETFSRIRKKALA